MERLQKVIAHAGVSSRRAAERLILEGRVTVNGSTVTELGTRVDPARDAVRVDGKRLRPAPRAHTYLMLHKPDKVVTTLSDPQGRTTVGDLLGRRGPRVYPVGRLDYHTEGLLLMTDDGELARDLMHPRGKVPKTYLAKVRGEPAVKVLERLRRGVTLDGRRTLPARVRLARRARNSWLELTLVEGRNRQVRRMLEKVGHAVMILRRTGYGGLSLAGLAPGAWRRLTPAEVDRLRAVVEPRAGGDRP